MADVKPNTGSDFDFRTQRKRSVSLLANSQTSWSKLLNCALVLVLALVTHESWVPLLRVHDLTWPWYPRLGSSVVLADEGPSNEGFAWHETLPFQKFVFAPCYDGFECARLEVPMDRHSDDDHDTVVLAVIRLPAQVAVTDPRYGGVVFLNPGGPGGSGVELLLGRGRALQAILDDRKTATTLASSSEDIYYDTISWDPRGIGRSTPALRCYPDSFARDDWGAQRQAEGLIGGPGGDAVFETVWARYDALGQQCARGGNRTKIAKHMNTPTVVMDMLDMLERYGEWREDEAKSLLHNLEMTGEERDTIHERTHWNRGGEMLQSWGFSYGTVLGSTFATMFPDRIHRLVLDGVVDTSEYYSINKNSIVDVDQIMHRFAEYCYAAGAEKCAFYSGESAGGIYAAIERVAQGLHEAPLVAQTTFTQPPDIVAWTDFMGYIFHALYNPYMAFEQMAEVLANLQSGNGSMLADLKRRDARSVCSQEQCKAKHHGGKGCDDVRAFQEETAAGVACADGADMSSMTKDEYRLEAKSWIQQSRWFGSAWATAVAMPCVHWKIRPAWDFHGPIEGNTSAPLLLVSTTYDPVCPLQGAHAMSKRFPGSVVLEQNSEGHCSWSSPSLCTAQYISEYFRSGALPKPGTVCLPDARPFGLPGNFSMTGHIAGAKSN